MILEEGEKIGLKENIFKSFKIAKMSQNILHILLFQNIKKKNFFNGGGWRARGSTPPPLLDESA